MDLPESVRISVDNVGGTEGIVKSLPSEGNLMRSARVFKALSDPLRLRIVFALLYQPLCVCLIKEITNVPDSKLSYHLSILRDANLIQGIQEGNWIIYHATDLCRRILGSGLPTLE